MNSKCHVLIPCAGSGLRIGGNVPKQFQKLGGQEIVLWSLNIFLSMPDISSIWVGLSGDISESKELMKIFPKTEKLNLRSTGGKTRALTVLNTLHQMLEEGIDIEDWVLVHDAARPGITELEILRLIQEVQSSGKSGGFLAIPLADTLKKSVHNSDRVIVEHTINRQELWQAQTPQMFKIGELKNAITKALENAYQVTDEASAMEYCQHPVIIVQGLAKNFKITLPEDLVNMQKMIVSSNTNTNLRIGQGYDVHQMVEGRPLILGGIEIPFQKGLLGHSDADALLHAITDALLGAGALGDIGQHFPDNDPSYKGANSLLLLEKSYLLLKNEGYEIVNIDATIICQQPKLMPFLPAMSEKIASTLKVKTSQVNVKAKTNESLGYLGAGLAIATQAIVLINKVN